MQPTMYRPEVSRSAQSRSHTMAYTYRTRAQIPQLRGRHSTNSALKQERNHRVTMHNSKADLRFLGCYVAKEGGRIQSGHSSFLFRFDCVRDTDCQTLTCHVLARRYSAVFQSLLFPHVWWRELKDTITVRFFRKRRRPLGGRIDSMSFLPFRFQSFARHGTRSSHLSSTCEGATANSADVCRGDQAVACVAHVSALQMQRKA